MAKAVVILNHPFNQFQKEGMKKQYDISEVVEMPDELKEVWKNIPPNLSAEQVREHIQPVIEWMNSFGSGNVVVVQGEFAATEWVVMEAIKSGNIPVMATTRRETVEHTNPDGTVEKKTIFKHVLFREYPLYVTHKREVEQSLAQEEETGRSPEL